MRPIILLLLVLVWVPLKSRAENTHFHVGVSLPLTGALAEYGEAVRNGIDLANLEEAQLASRVRFSYEDNAYEAKKAVSTFQKFADIDHVDAVLLWGNEPALSVAPIAEQRKMPTIVVAQYPQASLGKEFVIRFINTGNQYSETLLSYLRTQNLKRIAIIKSELSFFNMLVDGLTEGAKEEKIEIVDSLLPSEMDFRASIGKLKSRRFDILGVYLVSPQVRQFFRQSAELHFQPRVFGATPFESKSVIAEAWTLMEGAVFTHNAVTESFRERYRARFGNDMQLAYAANAYDFAVLTGRLFGSDSSKRTPTEIIAAYAQAAPATGASGPYRFIDSRKDGKHFEFDIVVRKIHGGGTEEVFRSSFGKPP